MALAMPCKTSKTCKHGETRGKTEWDQIKTCVHSGSQWIYKTAYGRIVADSSWRPYCRKRRQFSAALQFGAQYLFLCLKPWKFLQRMCGGGSRHKWRGSLRRSRAGYWSWSQGRRSRGRSAWRGRTGRRRWSAGRGKRRSRATQRETLIMDGMWMRVKDSRDDLTQCGCDTCVMKDKTI